MKLSEAIRLGAAKRLQAFEDYKIKATDGWRTCAIGAAYEALTGRLPPVSAIAGNGAAKMDTVMAYIAQECAVSEDILRTVVVLNDDDRESREWIAGWLERQGL